MVIELSSMTTTKQISLPRGWLGIALLSSYLDLQCIGLPTMIWWTTIDLNNHQLCITCSLGNANATNVNKSTYKSVMNSTIPQNMSVTEPRPHGLESTSRPKSKQCTNNANYVVRVQRKALHTNTCGYYHYYHHIMATATWIGYLHYILYIHSAYLHNLHTYW